MPYDAFISYSSRDKATADATCAVLEASGIRCWIAPRDIMPGAEWGEAIVLAINQCRVMVLIFSANANESPQIRREVERAVSKGVPIIPVRIQDIPPARSLEYFIGTVHWLDALTPPLEAHLRRLSETVKTLLKIDPTRLDTIPAPVPPRLPGRILAAISIAGVLAVAAGVGLWRFLAAPTPPAVSVSPPPSAAPSVATSAPPPPSPAPIVSGRPASPAPINPSPPAPPPVSIQAGIDPAVVATFTHDGVIDDYDAHFIYSLAADGTYTLTTTTEEDGTFQAARGQYRTVGSRSGRVRAGSYRAVGLSAIEIRSPIVTAVFHPAQPIAPLDQKNPVMLGIWRASAVIAGVPWTMTIENHSDGTYHYYAVAEDRGTCTFANQHWRETSLVTGQSNMGDYRIVDANTMETTGSDGLVQWRRR